MSADNPYAAPAVAYAEGVGRHAFVEMDTKELKKLRDASLCIRVLGLLWVAVAIFSFLIVAGMASMAMDRTTAIMAPQTMDRLAPIVISFCLVTGVLTGIASVCALLRPVWGRPVGMVICCLSLIHFPIGTLIGIIGLIAFSRGVKLFGPNRWLHSAIIAEWQQRKRNKVA